MISRLTHAIATLTVIAYAAAALTAAAHAEPRGAETDRLIDAAATAVAELRDDEALRLLDQAWQRGTSGPRQLRTIFALAGRASGVIGDTAAARTWFTRWLSLEPDAALPAGTSPNLTELLDSVRTQLASARLAIRANRGDSGVDVAVISDPASLVTALRAGELVAPANAHQLATSAASLDALDRYGNVVAVVAVEATAPAITESSEPAWYARAPTWAIGAGVAAVVGGVAFGFAVRAHDRLERDAVGMPEYSDYLADKDALSRAQWTSRIAFAAAAASAAVGGVLHFRGHRVHTAVIASPGTTQVAWSMQF